jgi:hypothetical protein
MPAHRKAGTDNASFRLQRRPPGSADRGQGSRTRFLSSIELSLASEVSPVKAARLRRD